MRNERVERFESLPLRAHSLFFGVPLHDLWMIELPGGRGGMTMADITTAVGFAGGRRRQSAAPANEIPRSRAVVTR